MGWPNRNKTLLIEMLGITGAAALLITWQGADISPAGALFLSLLSLSYINYILGKRDVLYPAFTFTTIWTAVIAAYVVCPIEIRPLGWKTTAILIAGAIAFSIGSFTGNRPFFSSASQKPKEGEYRDNPQARVLLLAYALFAVPWIFLEARRLVGGSLSLSPEFLIRLRLMIVGMAIEGDSAYGNKFISSAFIIGGLTFLILLLEERRTWAKMLGAFFMIVFFLMTTGRAVLMQALCWWLCAALLRRRDRRFLTAVKWLSFAFLGVLALMISLTFLTKSRTQGEGEFNEAADMAVEYVAGPIAAFDYAVYNPGEFSNQHTAVFQGLRTRLSNLNIVHSIPAKPFDDFVFVPFGMNVYTCFKPYYVDFGLFGCLLVFGFIGLVEGQLFCKSLAGNRIARFFFAYLSYPLMFSTFDDLYTTHDSDVLYIYMSIFAFGYFYVMMRASVGLFRKRAHTLPNPLTAT